MSSQKKKSARKLVAPEKVERRETIDQRAARREAKRRVANRKHTVDKALSKARSDRKKAEAKAKHDKYTKYYKYKVKERVEKTEKKIEDTRKKALENTQQRCNEATAEFNRKAEEIENAVVAGTMTDAQADDALQKAQEEAKQKIDNASKENQGVKPEDVKSDLLEKQADIENRRAQEPEEDTQADDDADAETSDNAAQTEAEASDLETDTGTVEEGVEDPDSVEGKLSKAQAKLDEVYESTTQSDDDLTPEAQKKLEEAEAIADGWVDVTTASGSQSIYLNVKYDETGADEAYISLTPIAPNGVEMHNRKRWESYLVGTVVDGKITQQVMAGTFEVDARRSPVDNKSIDRVESDDSDAETVLEIIGWKDQEPESGGKTLASTLTGEDTYFTYQQVLVRSGKNGTLSYLPIGSFTGWTGEGSTGDTGWTGWTGDTGWTGWTGAQGNPGSNGKDAGITVTTVPETDPQHPNGGTKVILQPTKDGQPDGAPEDFTVWNGNDGAGGGLSDPVVVSVDYNKDPNNPHSLRYQEGTVNLATGVVTPGAWKTITTAVPCGCTGGGGGGSGDTGPTGWTGYTGWTGPAGGTIDNFSFIADIRYHIPTSGTPSLQKLIGTCENGRITIPDPLDDSQWVSFATPIAHSQTIA